MASIKELYFFAKKELKELDSPEFDAMCLAEEFLHADRNRLYLHGEERANASDEEKFRQAVEKRKGFYPLQYILGYWYFRDMKLKVRDGVLCPREDTEVLVNESLERIKEIYGNKAVFGVDLCSGTGCVALGISRESENISMDAVELFDTPYECLCENIAEWGIDRVKISRGDVFSDECLEKYHGLDFLTANPPYISEDEMETLQAEVQKEPREALTDGGDGLAFYRRIIKDWKKTVKIGGFIALEIGETQAEAVKSLFEANGFGDVCVKKDFGELDRCVSAIKLSD